MTSTDPPLAGRREWLALAVLALPTLLVSMDLTVLHLALPSLSRDLDPSSTQLLWIVDVYGFLIAGALITMGTLGDRIGRRRLLLIGAAAFGAASVLAAFSTSAEMLIAARALLGVAGATLMPSTLSLIRNLFHDPAQRTTAIAVWMTSFMAGAAVGPIVGGLLLEQFWWGSVFLLGVPVMVLLLALGPLLLPESRDPSAGRLDLPSAALSLVAVLSLVWGVKRIAEHGADAAAVAAFVAGLLIGTVFVLRQRSLADPLIDLRLFRTRTFSGGLGTQTLTIFAFGGTQLFVGQYLQLVHGLSPLEAGLWLLPGMVAGIAGAMLAPVAVRHVRPARVIGTGLVLAAGGLLAIAFVSPGSGLALIVAGQMVASFGVGPAMTLTTDMIVGSAPPERAGSASAISETGSELGQALGIALVGSVGTAVYRSGIDERMPAGVPAAETEAARDTLGGAAEASDELPAPLGGELLDAAREAFTQGLQATATVSALVLSGVAAMALVLLRRTPPSGSPEPEPVGAEA